MLTIPGHSEDKDVDEINVHEAMGKEETLKTSMIIKIEELATVSHKEIFSIIEVEVKTIHFEDDKDSGMETTQITVTEIIGIEILRVKVILTGADDGTIVEARDIVIGAEGEGGTLINNIKIRGTNKIPSMLTQIITAHHLWDISINTQSHTSSIPILSNNNTHLKCHQPHHSKLQISVNYVRVKAIMIINANLQATLWPAHKKHLIKAAHITIKILIKESGQMVTMITMTQMGNLFSSGGSRCH